MHFENIYIVFLISANWHDNAAANGLCKKYSKFAVLTDNVYIGVIIHVANNMYASIREMILGDKIWEMSQTDFFINAIMGIFILLFSIFMINYETHNLAKRQKIDFRES